MSEVNPNNALYVTMLCIDQASAVMSTPKPRMAHPHREIPAEALYGLSGRPVPPAGLSSSESTALPDEDRFSSAESSPESDAQTEPDIFVDADTLSGDFMLDTDDGPKHVIRLKDLVSIPLQASPTPGQTASGGGPSGGPKTLAELPGGPRCSEIIPERRSPKVSPRRTSAPLAAQTLQRGVGGVVGSDLGGDAEDGPAGLLVGEELDKGEWFDDLAHSKARASELSSAATLNLLYPLTRMAVSELKCADRAFLGAMTAWKVRLRVTSPSFPMYLLRFFKL